MTLRDGSEYPYITAAKVKVTGSGRKVWDLYEGQLLIGWTSTDPGMPMPTEGAGPPFTPSCQQYGTGRHVIVTLSSDLLVS